MQAILCVDVSTEPAALQVLRVDQRNLELVESHSASLAALFSSTDELQAKNSDELQPEPSASGAHDSQGQEETLAAADKVENELITALKSIETPWTASVVIIPTPAYLSLNIELPFGDQKNLAKILDLEVQDRVPFDISEFLIDHRTLGKSRSGMYDIHVSLIPKAYIARVLKVCRASGLEPYILTTPASILDALFFIAPDYFQDNCAVVYLTPQSAAVNIRIDKQTRADRILSAASSSPSANDILTDLKLTISAVESRYEKQLECVYLVSSVVSAHDVQQFLGRRVESVDVAELVRNKPSDAKTASIAAVFAQDVAPPQLLTNFRTREFTYNVQLGELLRGLRRVLPFIGILLFALMFFLGGRYMLRQFQIGALEEAVNERILKVIPSASVEPGREVEWLLKENFELQNDLKDLGSPSKFSALDLLAQVTQHFPTVNGVNVREVLIQGNVIKVSGTAPDYSSQEQIEKALKSSPNKWKVSSKDAPGGIGGGLNAKPFSFEIRLLE